MVKVVVVIIALLAGYFLFFYDKLPKTITFQGHTLEKKEKEVFERADGKFAIYKYNDKPQDHFLVFVVSEDGGQIPVDEIKQFYIKRLKQQGVKLALNKQGRYLGFKHDSEGDMGQVYMTYSSVINAIIIYVRNSKQKTANKREADKMFLELEAYTF